MTSISISDGGGGAANARFEIAFTMVTEANAFIKAMLKSERQLSETSATKQGILCLYVPASSKFHNGLYKQFRGELEAQHKLAPLYEYHDKETTQLELPGINLTILSKDAFRIVFLPATSDVVDLLEGQGIIGKKKAATLIGAIDKKLTGLAAKVKAGRKSKPYQK